MDTDAEILVSGSIATDHLMMFPGRFAEQLLADQLDHVSLSFLVDELEIRHGGVAANITFGLGYLGLRPLLIGAVGEDFADYREWLEAHNVRTDHVHVSQTRKTARFICTTDSDNSQIASFYAGAMVEAEAIDLAPVLAGTSGRPLVVISPDMPEAMLRHTRCCRERGVPFIADPSQQLARMRGSQIRELVEGARYLVTNEYERSLLCQKTSWAETAVLQRVGSWITTLGAQGVMIETSGQATVFVDVVPETAQADPTGVGDAFRAGFLTGDAYGLDPQRSAQIGCTLATYVLETVGPQEYTFTTAEFLARLAATYGADAGAEVGACFAVPGALVPGRA